MGTDPNYDHYSLTQLRMMLDETDAQQMPERYRRLQSEIEIREEGQREYRRLVLQAGRIEGSGCLTAATIFVACVYSFPCFLIFVFFASGLIDPRLEDIFGRFITTVLVCGAFLLVPTVGIVAMRYLLREIDDRTAVKSWSLIAAAVAPTSSIAYFVLIPRLFSLNKYTRPMLNEDSFLPILVCCALGFYMPFVLLTFWLKYRYRQDEF